MGCGDLVRGRGRAFARAGLGLRSFCVDTAPLAIEVIETDAVSAPALHGIFRPRLLWPRQFAEKLTPVELRLVVAQAKVQTEVEYFHTHQERLDYRAARRRGEPIGSGAIEATCRQYQCRFKRTGQFWTRNGDESLLCLDTFWRNGRWSLLFPHVLPSDPARN